MKKELWLTLVLSFLLVVFVACNNKKKPTDTTAPDKQEETATAIETDRSTLDSETTVQEPDHDHVYELQVIVPPSCGVQGTQAYVCAICGKQQHETSIEALQHNYQYSDELSIGPTCTTNGKKVEHCYNCGGNKEEVWEATGHTWYTGYKCDSNTNEIVITPYCSYCSLFSTFEYRYKIDDVQTLVNVNGQLGELATSYITSENHVQHTLKAPYYRVYCSDTYLLIVRNTKHIEMYYPDGAVLNRTPMSFYTSRGCTVVFESNIAITTDGRIQIIQ